jgi:hypothetical protein
MAMWVGAMAVVLMGAWPRERGWSVGGARGCDGFAVEDTGGGVQPGSAWTLPGGPRGVVKSSLYCTHIRILGGGGPEASGLLLDPRQFNSLGVS